MTARRADGRAPRSPLLWVLVAVTTVAVLLGAVMLGTALARPGTVTETAEGTAPPTTLATVAVSAPPVSTPEAASTELTLMSFNILTSDPVIYGRNPLIPRRELAFAARAPGIAAQITTAAPDVAALQENFGAPMPYDLLRNRLTDYTWVQPKRQVTILVKTARFAVVESGYADLHETEKGFLSWVRLKDLTTGRPLWVFDVHLRAGNLRSEALIRSGEADRVRERILSLDPGLAEPVVVMGDLNTKATEKRALYRDPVVKLGSRGLVDAATVAASDLSNVRGAASFHSFKAVIGGRTYAKVVPRTGNRIDFIFVPRGTTVAGFGVLTGPRLVKTRVNGRSEVAWQGIVPSDHSPVVAKITLPEG